MRTREVTYRNKKGLLIYLTKEEEKDLGINDYINKCKKTYDYVSIFISGDVNIHSILKQIIQDEVKKGAKGQHVASF